MTSREGPGLPALLALSVVVLVAGCAVGSVASVGSSTPDSPAPTTSTSLLEATGPPAVPPSSASTTALPAPPVTSPSFRGSIGPVEAADLPHSWRAGCPVGPEELRLLTVTHHTFGGEIRQGRLVVHVDHTDGILRVMERLFELGFPLERMEPVDAFGGDDEASMAANNTSAFNCRSVTGRPGTWSQHAYGWAIDLNPVQNPYVTSSGHVYPAAGRDYLDRSGGLPGMIGAGDEVVRAFESIGWSWGGYWQSSKDYQHFSATGR